MSKCTKCGFEMPEGVSFCTECGTPVVPDEVDAALAAAEEALEGAAAPAAEEAPAAEPASEPASAAAPAAEKTEDAPEKKGLFGRRSTPTADRLEQKYGALAGQADAAAEKAEEKLDTPLHEDIPEEGEPAINGGDPFDRKNKYGLIQTKGVVVSWLLMSVPVLGWLLAGIWALGLCRKAQRKYLARGFLLLLFIGALVCLAGVGVYRLVFHFTLADLPTVLTAVSDWIYQTVAGLFAPKA